MFGRHKDGLPTYGPEKTRVRGVDRSRKVYKCDWPGCGYEFAMYVGVAYGGGSAKNEEGLARNPDKVTTQVVCPRCGNGLPTGDI